MLSDKNGKIAGRYGVLVNLGIIKIAKVYLNVKTSRHTPEIVDDLKKPGGDKI